MGAGAAKELRPEGDVTERQADQDRVLEEGEDNIRSKVSMTSPLSSPVERATSKVEEEKTAEEGKKTEEFREEKDTIEVEDLTATKADEVASPISPSLAEKLRTSEKIQVQFAECLEVLQNCDQWSESERKAFVQRIKDERLDFLVDACDEFGNTLLILATMGYQDEIVELLLQHGAEPDHQNMAGFCAMHYCAALPPTREKEEKVIHIVKMLLRHGASTNLIEATAGCTPLHYAASENNHRVCDMLVEKGASVGLRCKNGFLPEAYARASGHNELADHLHNKMKKSVSQEVRAKIARQENNGGHGWKMHLDPETEKYFYFNHITGKSTWDRPVEMDILEELETGETGNEEKSNEETGNETSERGKKMKTSSSKTRVKVNKSFSPRTPPGNPIKSPKAPKSGEPDLEKMQLKKQLEEMQKRLEEAQQKAKKEAAQNEQLRNVAKEADARFERELERLKRDLKSKEANAEESANRIEELKREFEEGKKKEIERLKQQFEQDRDQELAKIEQRAQEERARHEAELEKRMEELQMVQEQLQKELKEKKMYYNQIEELKGSIRVCARIRPLDKREKERGCENVLEVFGDNIKMKHRRKSNVGEDRVETKTWTFDKCLGPTKGQEDVFEDTERLIQSAVDGYNVCIFAYGQTGAGKTYTMSGPDENPGILPRAVETLYSLIEKSQVHYQFSLELYMCELHLDTLVDLLSEKNHKDFTNSKTAFQIKKDQFGVVTVENITIVPVDNKEELMTRIRHGESRRSTDSTNMNDASSRSHLIISIIVRSENRSSGEITSGKLTLVDLAGSERVAKSGAEGQTFKEATSINKALSALGEVINALTTNNKHVPYRNNPLTQLMSDSIGGNAKTLMIVNVSPADYNANETIASLNFASRCKGVKNSAYKGFETKEIAALRREIAKLRKSS